MYKFPQESVRQAREIVEKYRRRSNSKLEIAAQLYDGWFYHIGYGFSEAVRDGNCGKYLHEVKKETDCFAMAGVLYLIAREAGLNPEIYLATKLRDHKEGIESGTNAGGDHTFITTRVSKNKTYVVDKHMTLFGKASFKPDENLISVNDKLSGNVIFRKYSSLRKLPIQEYLKMLEESRRPGGGRNALSNTQAVNAAGGRRNYLTFFSESSKLRASFHVIISKCGEESPNNSSLITDLTTRVEDNGDFDFSRGELGFYYAKSVGWTEHDTPQIPVRLPMHSVEDLWRVWQEIISGTGRKSPVSRMNNEKLSDLIRREGFSNNFALVSGSRAEEVIVEKGLIKQVDGFRRDLDASLDDYLGRCKQDEISYVSLLRHAHYFKQRDIMKNLDNPAGFLFSHDEHTGLLKNEFKNHKRRIVGVFRKMIQHAEVGARLKKGSDYRALRNFNSEVQRDYRDSRPFYDISSMRRSSFPIIFDKATDMSLFLQQLDRDKKSVSDLEKGLDDIDLKRAAEWRLFDWLAVTFVMKDALYLASFKRGLKKILDISGK